MDAGRFDGLARSIVPTRSRRVALRLAAGALASFAVAGGADAAHQRKTKCKHGEQKCKKTCCAKGERCAKGKCVTGQGTCKAGDDFCAGTGNLTCTDASGNNTCICLTRLQGGTRCGVYGHKSTCDQCAKDADCIALGFPPGSSCTQDFGVECKLCTGTKGSCIVPCGVPDPT